MNTKITFSIILFINFSIFGQVNQTMKRLPDTGQTSSYTNTFGEDSDFSINEPYYIDNGNQTITDTITNLMWQKSDGGEMTYENAIIYCDTLTIGGFTDWRLPNCHELFSILSLDVTNPALNSSYFTTTNAEYWWSSQLQANDPTKVWVTNAGGGVGNHLKTETISAGGNKHFNVKAVRGITIPEQIQSHFTINNDGTVIDNLTNLMWQQIPYNDSLTWEQALIYADTLNIGNFNDWRLPNIKELQSLNDETITNPSINSNIFNGILPKHYWSSTSLPNQQTKAWYLDVKFGLTTYAYKTSRQYLICTRTLNQSSNLSLNKEIKINNIEIYPNPTNNNLSFKTNLPISDFRVENLNGQIITSNLIDNQNNSYCFSIEYSGIYFVKFNVDGKSICNKIIVK